MQGAEAKGVPKCMLKPKCAVIMKWNKGRVDSAMEEEALRGFIKAKVVLEVDVGWIRGIDRVSC